jgi:PPOX class probable F420-dependent enzyme
MQKLDEAVRDEQRAAVNEAPLHSMSDAARGREEKPVRHERGDAFTNLRGHQFMSLTTFRKNGEPVPTPVWFAQVEDRLYVMTEPTSGKMKRIRNNAQVEVAPCKASGDVLGPSAEAMARILSDAEGVAADRALSRKYGVLKFLFGLMKKLRGGRYGYLEITQM